MKVAVHQPYLFPYIGYFQLIHCADAFVLYDDVSYIVRGYINRNYVLGAQGRQRFTVPVPGASQNVLIKDLSFSPDVDKLLRTLRQSYARAPQVEQVIPVVASAFEHEDRSIPAVCLHVFERIFEYLDIGCRVLRSSALVYDRTGSPADKLRSICKHLGSRHYVNAIGGTSLYSAQEFRRHGFELSFLRSMATPYSQNRVEFVPNLSIIDVLMWNGREQVRQMLGEYALV